MDDRAPQDEQESQYDGPAFMQDDLETPSADMKDEYERQFRRRGGFPDRRSYGGYIRDGSSGAGMRIQHSRQPYTDRKLHEEGSLSTGTEYRDKAAALLWLRQIMSGNLQQHRSNYDGFIKGGSSGSDMRIQHPRQTYTDQRPGEEASHSTDTNGNNEAAQLWQILVSNLQQHRSSDGYIRGGSSGSGMRIQQHRQPYTGRKPFGGARRSYTDTVNRNTAHAQRWPRLNSNLQQHRPVRKDNSKTSSNNEPSPIYSNLCGTVQIC